MNQHTIKDYNLISRFASSLGKRGKKVSGHKILLESLFILKSNAEKKILNRDLQKQIFQNKLDNHFFSLLFSIGFTGKTFQGFLKGFDHSVQATNTLSPLFGDIAKNEKKERIKKQNDFSKNANKLVKDTIPENQRVKPFNKTLVSQEKDYERKTAPLSKSVNTLKIFNSKIPFLTKNLLLKTKSGTLLNSNLTRKSPEQIVALLQNHDVAENKKKAFHLLASSLPESQNTNFFENTSFSNKAFSEKCRDNVRPILESRKVRKGRVTYRVPLVTETGRQEGKAITWIIESAFSRKNKAKSGLAKSGLASQKKEEQSALLSKLLTDRKKNFRSLKYCLAEELLDSFQAKGESVEKKKGFHKLALQNRAYTHFRWW